MKTVENIKVYYGLKWVEFKPITIEKRNRLYNNGTLYKIDNALIYIRVFKL